MVRIYRSDEIRGDNSMKIEEAVKKIIDETNRVPRKKENNNEN